MNIVVECFVIEINIGKKKKKTGQTDCQLYRLLYFGLLSFKHWEISWKTCFTQLFCSLWDWQIGLDLKNVCTLKKTLISHECNPSQRLYCSVRDLVIMTSSLLCYGTRLHRNMDYPLLSPSVRENLTGFGIFFWARKKAIEWVWGIQV